MLGSLILWYFAKNVNKNLDASLINFQIRKHKLIDFTLNAHSAFKIISYQIIILFCPVSTTKGGCLIRNITDKLSQVGQCLLP